MHARACLVSRFLCSTPSTEMKESRRSHECRVDTNLIVTDSMKTHHRFTDVGDVNPVGPVRESK